MGLRPDYATVVYCNLIRQTYKDVPIIIGGIEASLRRLSHYDYWSDKVKHSILIDSGADLISYGMGEHSIVEIADALDAGINVKDITYIRGTVYRTDSTDNITEEYIELPSYDEVSTDKKQYAHSFYSQYCNTDPFVAKILVEKVKNKMYVVQNPPAYPLTQQEMDDVYALDYMCDYHPVYKKDGGIPALSEIKFSLTSNRGCFGGCSFCALTFHQGRIVQTRSHESIINEAKHMTEEKDFKGYIHDVGGPTANFRHTSCDKQLRYGTCPSKQCLFPKPCNNLKVDHKDYVALLLLTVFQLLVTFLAVMGCGRKPEVLLSFLGLMLVEWALFFGLKLMRRRGFDVETIAFFLTTMGFAVVATSAPESLLKEFLALCAGLVVFLFVGWTLRDLERAKVFRYLASAAGLLLLAVNLVLGTEKFGARNWIQLGGVSFQPSELVKICFVYAGASTLHRLMAKRNLVMFIGYSAAICGCLALMNDFGTAIIFFVAFLVIAFLRSGDVATIALACAGTGFAGVLALRFKPYALKRFSAWGHVWENALTTGYSQTRAMMCIASGGLFGLGAGKGWLHNVGAADTDLVFALVSEEWGLILAVTLVASIAVLAVFVVRSAPVGRSCFYTIGACAAVTILVTQAILNVFGTVDILPLTGVTFPFVSNGGSSMLCVWGLLAFVKAADTRQNASFAIRLPGRKGA